MRAYASKAQKYSDDWSIQLPSNDVYALLKKFFIPKGKTADIGCGNGREAAWLASQGHEVWAFEASKEMLKIAKSLNPDLSFSFATLPLLREIETKFDESFKSEWNPVFIMESNRASHCP